MSDLNLIKPKYVQNIINKFCVCIGMIPTSYKNALSYEQQILAVGNYLENVVYPAINNNAEAVAELQNLFIELKDYVDNYFDNLDVQQEINIKLDEMVQSGVLANIINEQIFNNLNEQIQQNKEDIAEINSIVDENIGEESNIFFISSNSIITDQNNFVGDCCFIKGEKNILIDVGNQTDCNALINFLINNNINKIDYVILSHYHNDHIGGTQAEGLITLLNQSFLDWSECTFILPHKNINYTAFIPSSSTNTFRDRELLIISTLQQKNIAYVWKNNGDVLTLSDKESITFYNTNIDYTDYYNETIDAQGNNVNYTNYNNFSLICVYKHFENTILFTGDIEYLAEEKNYQYIKNCDVLKIEHHGLNVRSNKKYLNNLNPKLAIICNSQYYDNPSDIAHPTTFEVCSKGAKIYETRNNLGSIEIISKYNGIFSNTSNNSNLYNMQYDLYSGQDILEGDDLNNYTTPGVYNSNNATRSATLLNMPLSLSGTKMPYAGFKLIVENLNGYHNYIRQKIMPSNDNGSCQYYVRDTYEGSFENIDWKVVTPSVSVGNLNTQEIEDLGIILPTHTSTSNRIIKHNGIVQLQFNMVITQDLPARSVILNIPNKILKSSGQSGYFLSHFPQGTYTLLYTNGTSSHTEIKNNSVISANTPILFLVTLISEE